MTQLTAERLRELLDYDPETGLFTRKVRTGRMMAGAIAGSHSRGGRRQVMIDGRNYQLSRVAWLWMTGEWPVADVDHKRGDPSNNTWENLRDITHRMNTENKVRAARGNRSGYLGVTAHQGRFRADLTVGGKRIYIGMFATALEAHAAYIEVKRKHHKGCTI